MRRKSVSGSAILNKPATGTIHKNLKFKAIKLCNFKIIQSNKVAIELHIVKFWSEIILVILNRTRVTRSFDFEITRMISDQFRPNCTPLSSIATLLDSMILKLHNFMALNLRYLCSSSRFVQNSGTRNAFTSHLESKTMSCGENSFGHDKETSISEVRTKIVHFMHKSSILLSWINDGCLPFFCGWGRDFSLSLGKEFDGAAGVILRWISFELWNSLKCMMPSG